MYHYIAYGLYIQSDIQLPELIEGPPGEDITIRLSDDYPGWMQLYDESKWQTLTGDEATLSLLNVCVIKVNAGREIIVAPSNGVRESLIRLLLLGVVLAVALYQRGKLVLHASSVDINGNAIAFLGESGWGKSSIAAAFIKRGYRVIADDVTPVDFDGTSMTVTPGIPRLKIDPEVATSLGFEPSALHFIDPIEKKMGIQLDRYFTMTPLPLKRLYILSPDSTQDILPLTPKEAIMELLRHTYPTRLLHSGGPVHLVQCAQLARDLPVYRLKRNQAVVDLPDLVQKVESGLSELT